MMGDCLFPERTFSSEKSLWKPLLKAIIKRIPERSAIGPIIFNIFNNDIFYFIGKCDFINCANDDTFQKFQVQSML